MKIPPSFNFKVVSTVIFASILGILLITFVILKSPENYAFIVSLSILGGILGWVFAFITSPYDKADKERLNNTTKVFGSFLTGYVISKADNPLRSFAKKVTTDSAIQCYAIAFVGFFCLSWLVVYVFRVYVKAD